MTSCQIRIQEQDRNENNPDGIRLVLVIPCGSSPENCARLNFHMDNENKSLPREYRLIGPSDDGSVSDSLDNLTLQASRQRLQALISEWLRMENVVVLTAAGCSASLGGKLMANLEKAVLDTIASLSDCPASIKTLVSHRNTEASKDDALGFEEWLSFLVNASYVGSAAGSPFSDVQWKNAPGPSTKELSWFVEMAGKAIFAECALRLPQPLTVAKEASEIAPHLAFLSKLVARDSNLGRIHLFTLNYDTLFEQALEMLGIQYFDGFTGRADARFDPSVYGLDIYYPGEIAEGRVRRFDKFLHFYKLHGSIHWYADDNELRARHPDLSVARAYRNSDAANKGAELAKIAGTLPSAGILPTANKFLQTLSMPYAHLFRSFQIRLSAPQTFLLVLGYGFGDDHVTRMIETALMNPSLVMLVVEPNPNSPTIKRIQGYKDLGKRAFVLTASDEAFHAKNFDKATFDDFALSIMPDVQWLDDFLRLRRFEKQIRAGSDGPNSEGAGS